MAEIVLSESSDSHESSIIRIILYSIKNLPVDFDIGIKNHIRILRGSSSSKIIDHDFHKSQAYGLLEHLSWDYFLEIFDIILDKNLIEELESDTIGFNGEPIKVIHITKEGIDFLNSDIDGHFGFIKPRILEYDEQLFNILRILRKSLADELGYPTYAVTNNEQLISMSILKPTSFEKMLEIKGIGPKFIENYGQKFLDTILIYTNQEDLDEGVQFSSNISPDFPKNSNDSISLNDNLFDEVEESSEDDEEPYENVKPITGIEDRIEQEKKRIDEYKNADPRPYWKRGNPGNEGTERWRNKKSNKHRRETPYPNSCKVCGEPLGKTYSYQCPKCKSPM